MRHPQARNPGLLTLACVCLFTATHAAAQGPPTPTLPNPSGVYTIGREAFDLVDPTRPDPFAPDPNSHRELMVYAWYPAQPTPAAPPAPYFPFASEIDHDPTARAAALDLFGASWPAIVAGTLTSHAVANAPLLAGAHPVILFSHGDSATSFSYTAQIEDLVSHGYIVLAIEHTDSAGLIHFPGSTSNASLAGRNRLYHEPTPPAPPPANPMAAMIQSAAVGNAIAADDLRFVLDSLARGRLVPLRTVDLHRVAAVGHSAGGDHAARACQLDPRLRACVSEDGEVNPVGAFFDYPDHTALPQPFLLLEIANHPTDDLLARMGETRAQWNAFVAHETDQLAHTGPGSAHSTLNQPGMNHASFSDGPLLANPPGTPQAIQALANLATLEQLVRDFLDRRLPSASHTASPQ